MKKAIFFLAILTLLVGCKDEIVKEPKNLIEKNVMINVMYDLSILEAIKYQNPTSLDTYTINPTDYIFKKYKIDSIQFSQSNIYYASDYKEYKKMYKIISDRLDKNKLEVDALIKVENKKQMLRLNKKEKLKQKKIKDSIAKIKRLTIKKDSLQKRK